MIYILLMSFNVISTLIFHFRHIESGHAFGLGACSSQVRRGGHKMAGTTKVTSNQTIPRIIQRPWMTEFSRANAQIPLKKKRGNITGGWLDEASCVMSCSLIAFLQLISHEDTSDVSYFHSNPCLSGGANESDSARHELIRKDKWKA